MRRESAVLERWFFYQDAAGLWKWARLDLVGTVLDHSGSSFETREACVEHAARNGYDDGRGPARNVVALRAPGASQPLAPPEPPAVAP